MVQQPPNEQGHVAKLNFRSRCISVTRTQNEC